VIILGAVLVSASVAFMVGFVLGIQAGSED
jgi:hypothetical protein